MGSPLTFFKLQQGPTLLALDLLGRGGLGRRPDRESGPPPPADPDRRCLDLAGRPGDRRHLGPAGATAHGRWPPPRRSSPSARTCWPTAPSRPARCRWWPAPPRCSSGSGASSGPAPAAPSGRRPRPAAWPSPVSSPPWVIPPILALTWAIDLARAKQRPIAIARKVVPGMIAFVAALVATDLVVTGFAAIPLSPRTGSHPVLEGHFPQALAGWADWALAQSYPQDWVGFANQVLFQGRGGPSYSPRRAADDGVEVLLPRRARPQGPARLLVPRGGPGLYPPAWRDRRGTGVPGCSRPSPWRSC